MGLPKIAESAASLKAAMNREQKPLKRKRLQVLYVVASGAVKSRQEAAAVVGVGRNAVGKWLGVYEREGLEGCLRVQKAAGRVPSLNAEQEAHLVEALGQPSGFASYEAVREWIVQQFGVKMSYAAVFKLVHVKLGASLKVPRKSHLKKTKRPLPRSARASSIN